MTFDKTKFFSDLPPLVPVDVGGQTIYMRTLSAAHRVRVSEDRGELVDGKLSPSQQLRLCVSLIIACACDSNGQTIFTEDDRASIENLPAATMDKMAGAATEANSFGVSVEKIEKN